MEAIIFIDGNNLYHNLIGMGIKPSHLDFQKLVSYICEHYNFELKKVVYYNSMPDLKDGKLLYYSHLKFIDELRKLPKFEVKTRKLQVHSTKELLKEKQKLIDSMDLCKVCEPVVEETILDAIGNVKKKEKGIDVQLAIDFVENAIDKNSENLILFSGDADFIPAMELAKKKGARVISSSVPKGYSWELRNKFEFFTIGKRKLIENCLK